MRPTLLRSSRPAARPRARPDARPAEPPDGAHPALWPQVSGPYVTLALLFAVELLGRMVPGFPDPWPVILMSVVYAGFAGGLRGGLMSAALACAYAAAHLAQPGQPLTYTDDALRRLLMLLATTPALAVMVGWLKRRAERAFELQAAHERLVQIDRFKTQFINNAAHELGTPLTPIRVQLHLLEESRSGELNEQQRKAVEMLNRNVQRLAALVQDVLDVARLQAGRLSVNPEPMELGPAVEEAVESFRPAAEQAGLELAAYAPADLVVLADPKRVAQVLTNLLSNAIKFTPRGGRVQVRVRRQGGEAVLEVRDTGLGLTEEQARRLFQPFSQVHDALQNPKGGSGLGLFICRGFIEQQGGRISCASPGPGRGTTFTVTLPTEDAVVARGPVVRVARA
jgi:signal transduction histidine kinase